jgi:uncharacterized protein (DUF2141 family)
MRSFWPNTLLLNALILTYSFTNQSAKGTGNLSVIVHNIRSHSGQIGFCLFNSKEGFPNHPEKAMILAFVKVVADSVEYTFKNIQLGTYAISAFHDENNDKKVNSNFIGIPKEGIGVSNNAKGSFGPPKFDDAKFEFTQSDQSVGISLNYL